MPQVLLPHNWNPRGYQRNVWGYLERGGKRAVAVWHRRAGKDEVGLHWTAVAAHERVANYWHMLPQYEQARKAIWEAVNPHTGRRRIDEAFPLAIRETTREQEMMIRFKCGSTWQVVGSDNFDRLVGSAPAGIVFSEYALAKPSAWDFLRPILAENKGWALFIYTPRGRNHGADLYELAEKNPDWFAERLTVKETGREELAEQERRDGMPDDMVRQEYYCSFDAAMVGSYYGRLIEQAEQDKRVGIVPYEPMVPVNTAWDLGIDDSTVVWFFQVAGQQIRVIDYYEASGADLTHYAKVLDSKPYKYGDHLLPHDVKVRELGVDSARSRLETLQSLGMRSTRVVANQRVEDGINAVKTILPRCWFDKEKCDAGLKALRQYHREWDDERKTFATRPFHDWSSHAADAFRYLAVGFDGLASAQWIKPPDYTLINKGLV